MNHGSLFSGIGGFDLAASWMGWENVFFCELDPFCRIVLKKYWPNATCIENIEQFPATQFRVDVLSGGFPCQAFSVAGSRQGTADPRYLWPAMFRTIKFIKPAYVVAENVVGIISWQHGLVFEQVHLDLESEGYQVWTFVLPAVSVGAPHLRSRVWFLGYNPGFDIQTTTNEPDPDAVVPRDEHRRSNTNSPGLEGTTGQSQTRPIGRPWRGDLIPVWDNWPLEPPVCERDNGLPSRLVDISIPSWRKHSLMALGNSIVPQVALRIFESIAAHHQIMTGHSSPFPK